MWEVQLQPDLPLRGLEGIKFKVIKVQAGQFFKPFHRTIGSCDDVIGFMRSTFKLNLFYLFIIPTPQVEESKHGTFNMLTIKMNNVTVFHRIIPYKITMYQINHCI